MQLELERLRLKRKTDRSGGERREVIQAGGANVVSGKARFPDLPHFIDKKYDLDSYFMQFKRYATVANWLKLS